MPAARLYAMSVEVHCPVCDAPIEDPQNGSYQWEPYQLKGKHMCQPCGKLITVGGKMARIQE